MHIELHLANGSPHDDPTATNGNPDFEAVWGVSWLVSLHATTDKSPNDWILDGLNKPSTWGGRRHGLMHH
jgi:hypothetical protein